MRQTLALCLATLTALPVHANVCGVDDAAGEARIAAERIAAVIGCTAFDAGPDQPPFVLNFDLGVAELLPGEPAAGLLERASAELKLLGAAD